MLLNEIKRKFKILFLFVCIFSLSPIYSIWYEIEIDGETRRYLLYLPDSIEENSPLVFVLHGYGGGANQIRNYSQMNQIGDEYGAAICYPQGLKDEWNWRFWNVGYDFHNDETVNDVHFLTALAQHLQTEYNLSSQHTFVTGMSNGGDMSYMLACQAPDVFRAIAPVAGCMMAWIYESCEGEPPVPVLEIHGTNDNTTLWDGDMENEDGYGAYLGTEEGIDFWVQTNNCTELTEEYFPDVYPDDDSEVLAHRYTDGVNNNEVWLYEVINGGHDWPGSYGNMDIDASEEIWSFFTRFISTIDGDVNQDGDVDILDVVFVINFVLDITEPTEDEFSAADLNEDGVLDVLDVVQIVSLILL